MRYPPVNFCIYCGRSNVKLSDEHIVMRGLGGRHILPSSSCQRCAQSTSRDELFVSRHMWNKFKRLAKFPSRHTDPNKPLEYEVSQSGRGDSRRIAVPPGGHLAWLYFPIFPEPEFLTQIPLGEVEVRSIVFNPEEMKKRGWRRVQSGRIDVQCFCRFLAKIAHAYACAELGAQNFNPYLKDVILGQHPKPSIFVGCYADSPVDRSEYRLQLGELEHEGRIYKVVFVWLFSNCGSPEYAVIVGD